ncbi:MAG TPA: hypothetical protein VK828_13810 [Terriglobales bacterium]|jgi:hypothetical protein|nr:hypothetical protein [Terriglobales bacterium]
MNEEIAQEILQELISSLEALETQTGAILQFLNDKELAEKEEIASYLERAGQASSVRWRAARARIERLVSSLMKNVEEGSEKEGSKKEPPKSTESKRKNETDLEKKTSLESDNAGHEELRTKDSKERQRESTTREITTADNPARNGEPVLENIDTRANQVSDGSHGEGNEEHKVSADANISGTDTNEKAA